jgi:hypothetical protein
MPAWPFSSLSDGETFAGRSKYSPIEKAVCGKRHRIIKKLHHQVITFTGLVKVAKLNESRSCGSTNLRSKYCWPSAPLFSIDLYRLAF